MISPLISTLSFLLISTIHADVMFSDSFDNDGLKVNTAAGGVLNSNEESSGWSDNGNLLYSGKSDPQLGGSLVFSQSKFTSDTGFTLTARCHAEQVSEGELAIGLISTESNLAQYKGKNPFREKNGAYGIGVSLSTASSKLGQGVNFINGKEVSVLDASGVQSQLIAGQALEVTLEVEKGGYWCYRINGEYESSGVLAEGIDLTKGYHVAIFSTGAGKGRKLIEFIKLEKGYAAGERAAKSRGTWSGGMGLDKIEDLRTLDTVQVRLTDGAVLSAAHWAPNKLLEKLWGGDKDAKGKPVNLCVPLWGDLSKDEPDNDPIKEKILAIRAAGFKVKAYANCENFNGRNSKEYEEIAKRWKHYCDTNPEVVKFVKSQPFHTGIWDAKKKKYVDATEKFPNRKYMFCYAEYILKDYALRYGKHVDAWIFDSAKDINAHGDKFDSGVLEEQRIYQAFAKAVHAGNPNIAIAFNNGRSTVKKASFPYAIPTHFDDFTFGHAFGGNNSHGAKPNTFNRNYLFVKKMMETNGYVFNGGKWKWDDKIVGNFHSKLSTAGWKSGGKSAWETADFLKWNLDAMKAEGIMTWDGSAVSKKQRNWVLRPWSYELLKALDDHLAVHQFPKAPNWARAYTVLPEAKIGESFSHNLVVGKDLWDPEGDSIVSIVKSTDTAPWLSIVVDPKEPKVWKMSGKVAEAKPGKVVFTLMAKDSNGDVGTREVELKILR